MLLATVVSMLDKLRWSATAIYTTPATLRRLGRAVAGVTHAFHHVRLTAPMKDDLRWNKHALLSIEQNEIAFKHLLHPHDAGDCECWTDVSTSIGLGGFSSSGACFMKK